MLLFAFENFTGKSFHQQRETLKKNLSDRNREQQGKSIRTGEESLWEGKNIFSEVTKKKENVKILFNLSFLQRNTGIQRKARNKRGRMSPISAKIQVRLRHVSLLFRRRRSRLCVSLPAPLSPHLSEVKDILPVGQRSRARTLSVLTPHVWIPHVLSISQQLVRDSACHKSD